MQTGACSFTLLGLDSWLCRVVERLGWTDPSPIQRSTIPMALKGQDVIGIAETGSGKTGAFLLPILQHWARADRPSGFALLLAPTRELAKQLADEVVRLSRLSDEVTCVQESSMRVVCLVGGEDMVEQALQLAWHRHHAIIATPGRLVDHIRQTPNFAQQQLSRIRHLVLDEADRMLNMAFAEDLDTILDFFQKPTSNRSKRKKHKKKAADKLSLLDRISKTKGDHPPPNRISLSDEQNQGKFAHPQTYLYSATMTKDVAKLRRAALSRDAVMVTCQPNLSGQEVTAIQQTALAKQTTNTKTGFPAKLSQYYLPVRSVDKPAVLDWLLSSAPTNVLTQSDESEWRQVLVFCKRCHEVRLVCEFLRERGHMAVPLTGRMEHTQRKQALADFLARKARILVATDVASRGLDMPNVHLVINYSIPLSEKTYRHRIGRTARAGQSGVAVTLVTRDVAHAFLELEAVLSPYLPRTAGDQAEMASIPRWPVPLPSPSGKHGMIARRRLAGEAWSKAAKTIRAQDAENLRRNGTNLSDIDSSDSTAEDVDLGSTDSEDSTTLESEDRADLPLSKGTTKTMAPSSELTTSGLAGIQAARQTWRALAKEKRKRNRERHAARESQREIASKGWGLRVLAGETMRTGDDDDGDADDGVDTDHLRFDEPLKNKYAKLASQNTPAVTHF